ncbi:MAG: phosphosulfolactate synthase [Bacteroidota bacterium]
MNFDLPFIPERTERPRNNGLTMVMDKGLSLQNAENFLDANGTLTDIIKLGFGTSYMTKDLKEKIKLYHDAGMKVYVGGTLFEAFVVRGMFDDYRKLMRELNLETCEVSDGSIHLPHDEKLNFISELAKDFRVLWNQPPKEL